MAAIIRIKRSTGTSAPGTLKTGELAYSAGTGLYNNGGDRLYYGKGDDGNGNATTPGTVIGGEYFTNKFSIINPDGVVEANKVVIVDASKKVDEWNVDNITINGNTISSTNTNGNITLDPNGSGVVDVSTSKITNVVDPTSDQDAATKKYVDDQNAAQTLGIAGDAGSDTITLATETLTFAGGTGLSSAVTANTVTFEIDSTGVTAGSYGSASAVPILTINAQGQVTAASTAALSTTNVTEGTNLYYTSARADSDAKNAVSGGTGVTYNPSTGVIEIGQAVDSAANVYFASVTTSGNIVVNGDLQVNGTTTTISTVNLEITDNMIYMNAGESSGSPLAFIDIGFAANVNDTGSYQHVGLFRDATDGVWKLFEGYTPEPDSDLDIDVNHPSFSFAPLQVATITGQYLGFDSDFDIAFAAKSTTDLVEGTNLYYTTARADSDFDVRLATKTTDDLTEGSTNLYYTDEKVDDRVANLLLAGEGIDLVYVDNGASAGSLTVSAELATITNPGVASFDSDQFTVTSGAVSIYQIDGGTY